MVVLDVVLAVGARAMLDVDQSNLDVKEINSFGSNRQRCQQCGFHGFPKVEAICDSCPTAEPLSVFDVVAYVRKAGTGTNSTIVVEKIVPLTEFTLPDGSYLIDEYTQVGNESLPKWTAEVGKVMTQFDFEKVFTPPEPGYAAQILGKDNPFNTTPRGASAYRNNSPAEEEGGDSEPPPNARPPGIRRPGFKR